MKSNKVINIEQDIVKHLKKNVWYILNDKRCTTQGMFFYLDEIDKDDYSSPNGFRYLVGKSLIKGLWIHDGMQHAIECTPEWAEELNREIKHYKAKLL